MYIRTIVSPHTDATVCAFKIKADLHQAFSFRDGTTTVQKRDCPATSVKGKTKLLIMKEEAVPLSPVSDSPPPF